MIKHRGIFLHVIFLLFTVRLDENRRRVTIIGPFIDQIVHWKKQTSRLNGHNLLTRRQFKDCMYELEC